MVTWIASSAPAALVSVVSLAALTLTGHGGSHPLEWGDGPLTVDSLPRVTYVAHRGGAREVPENSMSGLMAAYRRGTAQVLDFDTRVLRDGTPVVFHDATLNRTTFLGGLVRKLDAEEWKGCGCVRGTGCRGAGGRSGRRRSGRCWTGWAGGSC